MKKSAYGNPILISRNNSIIPLQKTEAESELMIQDLIYNHPECLPISGIDESFNPLLPVCKELNTNAGPIDLFMISPGGEIGIIETKLWRNPEARRVAIAQILDYAKELSSWSYEDLQREVNRRLGTKGNSIYEHASKADSNLLLTEPDFIDTVSRNLIRGKFLLLLVGDGIREGVQAIAEFLNNSAHLNFTFAMVELSIYESEQGTLVVPKTLMKTTELSKIYVDVPQGFSVIRSDEKNASQNNNEIINDVWQKEKLFYISFWDELLREIVFDDPGQPMPKPSKTQNLFIYPCTTKKAWISVYFSKSQKRIGIYFNVQNDPEGEVIKDHLREFFEDMKNELGPEVNWDDHSCAVIRKKCDNVFDPENRNEIKEFFKFWMNSFVNTYRPRLKNL